MDGFMIVVGGTHHLLVDFESLEQQLQTAFLV